MFILFSLCATVVYHQSCVLVIANFRCLNGCILGFRDILYCVIWQFRLNIMQFGGFSSYLISPPKNQSVIIFNFTIKEYTKLPNLVIRFHNFFLFKSFFIGIFSMRFNKQEGCIYLMISYKINLLSNCVLDVTTKLSSFQRQG